MTSKNSLNQANCNKKGYQKEWRDSGLAREPSGTKAEKPDREEGVRSDKASPRESPHKESTETSLAEGAAGEKGVFRVGQRQSHDGEHAPRDESDSGGDTENDLPIGSVSGCTNLAIVH